MDTNVLYYGDNLEIIRKYIPDNSIDLIYLDPPFNSKAAYNVLFKEPSGEASQAQITAFDDTWHWGKESEKAFQDIVTQAPANVAELITAVRNFIHQNDMMAYLVMMCIRLLELKRILKDTGSIYLHCDPTASHYLKILLDTIFSINNFRNEIVWKRTTGHRDSHRWNHSHDIILFYSSGREFTWNPQYEAYDEEYIRKNFHLIDSDGRSFMADNLLAAGTRRGESGKSWHGIDPTLTGNHWQYTVQKLDEMDLAGRIYWPPTGRMPRIKRYLDQLDGKPATSVWDNITSIGAQAQERLGYPTQKPEALLERIIQASSNEGDLVLDPFCGCGTALVAAHKLNRKWIGIDVTHLAIGIMKWRLNMIFPGITYKVIGEPKDFTGAKELAKNNKYEFQWWAVSLIGGQPYGDKKKGADTGIDGYLYFMDEKDKVKKAIISVKGGGTSVKDIRDLCHIIDREKAAMGIFLTLEKPTKPMDTEAITKGFYHSPLGKDYQKIQIITIEELINGKKLDIPLWLAPLQAPPRHKQKEGHTGKLL